MLKLIKLIKRSICFKIYELCFPKPKTTAKIEKVGRKEAGASGLEASKKSNVDVLVFVPERSKQLSPHFLKMMSLLRHNGYSVAVHRSTCSNTSNLDDAMVRI